MQDIINAYYPEYCHSLEAVYGQGMMSEGGSEAIDKMFKNFSINGKKALDIGSGLGGVAYHLVKHYDMTVVGIEINPWMVKEASRRIPADIANRLHFVLVTDSNDLPFKDKSFDIVYSKGVLCHVENKQEIFKECYRVLKSNGILIINDWLSTTKGKWCHDMQQLIKLEGLPLYAETIEGYLEQLTKANFKKVRYFNLSKEYATYNENIVKALKTPEKKEAFIQVFDKQCHQGALDGYALIAKSMSEGHSMEMQFTAQKD